MQKLVSESTKDLPKPIPSSLANFSFMPDEAYIRLNVMTGLYGVSSSTIWRNCSKGLIPQPKKLSERCTAWSVKDIRDNLASKVGV